MEINNLTDGDKLISTLRLLYVEDDEEALLELAYFLKKRVSSLKTASNGVEALELIDKHSFDVIICDLWMPEMDGHTLIKNMRDNNIKIPVIITSAFSDIDTVLKAVDLGIVKYCVKPINIDEIMVALKSIASNKLLESGEFLTSDNQILAREERLEIEKNLKSGFAHILKNLTGKGPKKVHVSLGANEIEMWATGVLSPIETSLGQTEKHAGIVPYIRKAIYTSYSKEFEKLVFESLGRGATLSEIRNEIEENTDWITFKLD